MAILLAANQYGKAEVRLVHLARKGERHDIRDVNVSIALSGDFADTYLTGNNANVLPTDTQKNTVYAIAHEHGVGEIEEFGLLIGRHFVRSQRPVSRAVVTIEEYGWERLPVTGHSFVRSGRLVRTATATVDEGTAQVVSGAKDLMLLNSTGSEFWGYAVDGYTTLQPTKDRIMATAVRAEWRHVAADGRFGESYEAVLELLQNTFAETYSYSLQQTLHAMGRAVLVSRPEIAEIWLSLANMHHFLVDLGLFGLHNTGTVFRVEDRPYGLIEATVRRDDEPPARE